MEAGRQAGARPMVWQTWWFLGQQLSRWSQGLDSEGHGFKVAPTGFAHELDTGCERKQVAVLASATG